MKIENKNILTGLIAILDSPDMPTPTQAELDAIEKEELKQKIVNKAVTELVKILVQKNVIALNDFSANLKTMITRYNQL